MTLLRPSWICIFLVLSSLTVLAQAPFLVAPLPSSPLELATAATMIVNTPQNRTLVLGLLERARQNSGELYAVGGPPFTLRISFTASGQARYTGSGDMEETRYSRQLWRWSARLGSYSQLRVFQNGMGYDEKPPGPIPLRIQMVRGAIFWPMLQVRPGQAMRMASAKWNGMEVMCALLGNEVETSTSGGRAWGEKEYCVDPQEGQLRIYSEAPGSYVTYDYTDALHFHGRILAREIAINEAGEAVLQLHLESISDPGPPDASRFIPSRRMLANGAGIIVLRAPIRLKETAPAAAGYAGTIQPVIIHAALDDHGKVVEAEPLQIGDPNLNNVALNLVRHATYYTQHKERGFPVQDEAFIQVSFGGSR